MFVFFVLFTCFCAINSQRTVGDLCTIESSGIEGECKILNECPKALEELNNAKKRPDLCGFKGPQPIVCCEKESEKPSEKPDTGTRRTAGEISLKKCREYSQYVWQIKPIPVLALGQEQEFSKKDLCGHKVVKLIVGGDPATKREFPHQAVIGFEPAPNDIRWGCGGSLISDKWVLTAAHCLYNREIGDAKYVRLGVISLRDERNKQQFDIVERVKHPAYRPPSHYNDVALVRLHRSVSLDPYAHPACLNVQPTVDAEKAIATGFGRTQFVGATSDDLLKVTLDLFDHNYCNRSYKPSRKLERGIDDGVQLCAGSLDEEKDTCQGDSGGPLQIYHVTDDIYCMYDLIGVTSFGKACSGSPGVYTRVSNYIKWIEDLVWPDEQ